MPILWPKIFSKVGKKWPKMFLKWAKAGFFNGCKTKNEVLEDKNAICEAKNSVLCPKAHFFLQPL